MNMQNRTIVAMPGDGIGKVVLDETIRVLDKAGFKASYVEGDIGWEFWRAEANPLPDRTVETLKTVDAALPAPSHWACPGLRSARDGNTGGTTWTACMILAGARASARSR